mgnify:CR=1 FL=1|jgi:hypothetical protein
MDFDHRDHERLEEMVQQTRWDEVTDARQRVLDRLQAIDRLQFETRGPVAEDRVATLYQRTVQLYVQQVETILDPVEAPTTEWWQGRWIAEFELPTDEVVEIEGLAQYVDLDESLTYTVKEEHKPHGAHVGEMREVERTVVPPVGVHRNAFRATNRALADQGIEFDTRERDLGDDGISKGGSL